MLTGALCLCVQVQHRAVFSLCCPFTSGLLPAQSQSTKLPPGSALASWLSEHALSSQLPSNTLPHGLSGMIHIQNKLTANYSCWLNCSYVFVVLHMSTYILQLRWQKRQEFNWLFKVWRLLTYLLISKCFLEITTWFGPAQIVILVQHNDSKTNRLHTLLLDM